MAYKPIEDVMENSKELVQIVHTLRQGVNLQRDSPLTMHEEQLESKAKKMEEKYESRSVEKVNNFQILCPEHGEQATYVLYYTENATRKTASGCWKCFDYLPVNPTPHCSDSVENDQ